MTKDHISTQKFLEELRPHDAVLGEMAVLLEVEDGPQGIGPEVPVCGSCIEAERVEVVLQGGDVLPVEHGKAVEQDPIPRAESGIYQ